MKNFFYVAAILVLCFCVIAVSIFWKPEKTTQENVQQGIENLPTQEIENIIIETFAQQRGVAEENVKIYFLEQTEETNVYAVGAAIRENACFVFLYNLDNHEIHVKAQYSPSTDNEVLATSIVIGRISKWTGNPIVPVDFTSSDGGYYFTYYDGFSRLTSRWSFGWGIVYLDNKAVEWGPHSA